jgi:ribose 5-phosphate isomerase B
MKGSIIQYIQGLGHQVVDVGCYDERPVDFPDLARSLTSVIKNGDAERGVMVCGTGVGACIAANKVSGIRAAVCHDVHSAHQCVEHDDVNVICLGAQIVGPWLANDLIAAYLEARFSGDADFVRRVEKLGRMDGSVA